MLELDANYVRREASTDREMAPDEMITGLANVMVNREPEFGLSVPSLPLGRRLSLRAEVVKGTYSETEEFTADARAEADRTAATALLTVAPYSAAAGVTASHAIGWRRSTYSPGEELTLRFVRHSLTVSPSPSAKLAVSYITRRGSGETPFLFDRIEVGRELLSDLRLRLSERWSTRLVQLYDLDLRDMRDMIVSATRTAHCLEYTVGWRRARGSFFVGIGIARPSGEQ
jgi:hypothetical protein